MNNDGEQDKMVLMEISILRHNFNTDLWRLDLSESGQSSCQIDSDVRLANLLVSLIIDGKYEQALDEGKKLNLFSSVDAWCSKVGDELCKNVHNYVSTSEPSSSIRPLTILCVAVASLELFVQNNWLGPPTKSSPLSVLGDSFLEEERTGNLTNHIQTSLTLDGDLFSSSAKCSLYLYIARSILLQCKDDIAECLFNSSDKDIVLKKEKIMANDEYRDLAIQCHLTAGHMCYFYYEPRQAKEHFSQAEKLSGLDIKLTGVLGKRTHFQERDISQLMLEVKHSDSIQPWASDEATSIPVNVRLDDDTLLDSLPLVNKDKQLLTPMSAIQQAVVLALCYNHRHSKEISQIVQEESEAFITELVSQYRRGDPGASDRLYLIYTLNMPTVWEIEADKLVREQLLINDKPLLWCYLGDIHDSEEYYLKAVDLSKGKFGRALRSLAYLKLHRKQFIEALKYFEKSLEVNGLQIGVWFSYGCTALRVENYNLAAKAFRTCVNLDTDNYEAWNNLATAYIKSNQKVRAFAVLQEAIKCEFENWRLWENYLLVSSNGIKYIHASISLIN
ncbi:hypothetical protein LSH36_439g03059 [Paralvinella palmiformis]|uniref:Tetratricopeptide repeat protein 27 n=1 Tax=Paralvinella palmiformis TaxID=53620 RepID=A0AAD9MXR9_9ANNE|nr:hypothetical protein LSH36_439g03059 [Paralvinella palmiformis]